VITQVWLITKKLINQTCMITQVVGVIASGIVGGGG
jgi:hypothetical protein